MLVCFSYNIFFTVVSQDICCRYPIYGGMQDWNYIHYGCFELTLEISDIKWPSATEVRSQLKCLYLHSYKYRTCMVLLMIILTPKSLFFLWERRNWSSL